MKTSGMALAVLLALGLSAPARAQSAAFMQGENKFAISLYGKLAAQPGNFVVSPYSVAMALGMVYAGAKGQTAVEIASALQVQNMSLADFERQAARPVLARKGDITFTNVNALWAQRGFALEPDFRRMIQQTFNGNTSEVDFSDPDDAAGRINAWADVATHGKIKNFVTPQMLRPPPVMVLANAVYFKAVWRNPFDKRITRPGPFHVAPGRDVSIPMMGINGTFLLAQEPAAQILTLPYTGDASMIIILPTARFGLPAIEAGLSDGELNRWLADQQEAARTFVSLPKFRVTSVSMLQAPLAALGVKAVFLPGVANLSGMSVQALYLSAMLQKTFIDVNEGGTEVAGVTGVFADLLSIRELPTPQFIADHPFLYLIRANATGAILFMGRVENPISG